MTIQRIEVDSLMGSKHGPVILEGHASETLPQDRVYVDTANGKSFDGRRGNSLSHLQDGTTIELPRTRWFSIEDGVVERLQLECMEMQANPLFSGFSLFEDTSVSSGNPARYFWEGKIAGRKVTLKYPNCYPSTPIKVFVSPMPRTHHKWGDGSVCLLKSEEWSPDMTAATMAGITARFLDENARGLTG